MEYASTWTDLSNASVKKDMYSHRRVTRVSTWTNVRRIPASASTVAAKTFPARINASVTTDSPNRPSDHSASTWMNADSPACAPTANASTWRAPSNASAIPATSCQLMAKLAQTLTSACRALVRTEFVSTRLEASSASVLRVWFWVKMAAPV